MSTRINPIKCRWLVLAGAALGLLAGVLWRPDHGSSAGETAVKGSPVSRAPHLSPLGRRQGLPQTEARLEALRMAGPPSRQISAALALAEISSVEEIRDLLENSHRFPSHSGEGVAIGTLLKRWLELDAAGAVEYCQHHQSAMLPKLLANWSMEHPAEAATWVRDMPPGKLQKEAWLGLCAAEGTRDPDKAWKMLVGTPGFNPASAWDMVPTIRALVGRHVETALTRLDRLPPAIVSAVQTAIASELMKIDPARAWAWARQLPQPLETTLAALNVAIISDPAQALDLMQSLPAAELQRIASDLQREGINRNAPEFTALLRQEPDIPEATRQKIAEALFRVYIWEDPKAALDLISLMSAEGQLTAIKNAVENWSKQNAADARAWVDSLPEGPLRTVALETQARLDTQGKLARPAERERLADALKQFNFVGEIDPGVNLVKAEQFGKMMEESKIEGNVDQRDLLAKVGTMNPTVVATWLESTSLDSKTGPIAAQFSSHWAKEDPTAAAAWVTKLPTGNLAQTTAANVAREYHRFAPAEAAAWVAQLPPGPVQDAAQQAMAGK